MKKLLLAALLTCAGPVFADDFLDTQYGPFGWEVHLLRASIANDVLTIAFMIENTGSSAEHMDSLDIEEVAYTTTDMKFPVLTDVNGAHLASTIAYERGDDESIFRGPGHRNRLYLTEGERQVGWIKFEAPEDSDWPIDLSLPGVSPFTIANPAE